MSSCVLKSLNFVTIVSTCRQIDHILLDEFQLEQNISMIRRILSFENNKKKKEKTNVRERERKRLFAILLLPSSSMRVNKSTCFIFRVSSLIGIVCDRERERIDCKKNRERELTFFLFLLVPYRPST